MHEAGAVELQHGRIHQGIAGAALAPCLVSLVGMRSGLPGNMVVFRLEGLCCHMREMVQDAEVEVAPDQFRQPYRRALAAFAVVHRL